MTDQIHTIIIRVPKKDSSYVYFTLEANEGLCFYSTLEHQNQSDVRDIQIKLTKSLLNEFLTVYKFLCRNIEVSILEDQDNIISG
jgi:hypothetical protein